MTKPNRDYKVTCYLCGFYTSIKSIKAHFLRKHPGFDYEAQKRAMRESKGRVPPVGKPSHVVQFNPMLPISHQPTLANRPPSSGMDFTLKLDGNINNNSIDFYCKNTDLVTEPRMSKKKEPSGDVLPCLICNEVITRKHMKRHITKQHPGEDYDALKARMTAGVEKTKKHSQLKKRMEFVRCVECEKLISAKRLREHFTAEHTDVDFDSVKSKMFSNKMKLHQAKASAASIVKTARAFKIRGESAKKAAGSTSSAPRVQEVPKSSAKELNFVPKAVKTPTLNSSPKSVIKTPKVNSAPKSLKSSTTKARSPPNKIPKALLTPDTAQKSARGPRSAVTPNSDTNSGRTKKRGNAKDATLCHVCSQSISRKSMKKHYENYHTLDLYCEFLISRSHHDDAKPKADSESGSASPKLAKSTLKTPDPSENDLLKSPEKYPMNLASTHSLLADASEKLKRVKQKANDVKPDITTADSSPSTSKRPLLSAGKSGAQLFAAASRSREHKSQARASLPITHTHSNSTHTTNNGHSQSASKVPESQELSKSSEGVSGERTTSRRPRTASLNEILRCVGLAEKVPEPTAEPEMDLSSASVLNESSFNGTLECSDSSDDEEDCLVVPGASPRDGTEQTTSAQESTHKSPESCNFVISNVVSLNNTEEDIYPGMYSPEQSMEAFEFDSPLNTGKRKRSLDDSDSESNAPKRHKNELSESKLAEWEKKLTEREKKFEKTMADRERAMKRRFAVYEKKLHERERNLMAKLTKKELKLKKLMTEHRKWIEDQRKSTETELNPSPNADDKSPNNDTNSVISDGSPTKATPHYCPTCERYFSNRYNLKRHFVRSGHTAVNDVYQCYMCKERFTSHCMYSVHWNAVHAGNGTRFRCEQCCKRFANSTSYHDHLEETGHTSVLIDPTAIKLESATDIPNPEGKLAKLGCHMCERTFEKQCNYERHLRRTHGVESSRPVQSDSKVENGESSCAESETDDEEDSIALSLLMSQEVSDAATTDKMNEEDAKKPCERDTESVLSNGSTGIFAALSSLSPTDFLNEKTVHCIDVDELTSGVHQAPVNDCSQTLVVQDSNGTPSDVVDGANGEKKMETDVSGGEKNERKSNQSMDVAHVPETQIYTENAVTDPSKSPINQIEPVDKNENGTEAHEQDAKNFDNEKSGQANSEDIKSVSKAMSEMSSEDQSNGHCEDSTGNPSTGEDSTDVPPEGTEKFADVIDSKDTGEVNLENGEMPPFVQSDANPI